MKKNRLYVTSKVPILVILDQDAISSNGRHFFH